MPRVPVQVFIAYSGLQIFDPRKPLALDLWEQQFAAWWKGWEEHWSSEEAENARSAPKLEDAFIPVGSSPSVVEHKPPARTVLEPHNEGDVPSELLRPVREWFEGTHARQWARVAGAFPYLDMSLEDQVRNLSTAEPQSWPYARAIEAWWIEGEHAHVRVRGVEHDPPGDGEPAENRETVWDFALRLRDSHWYIRTYSEGWPEYGSADAIPRKAKPWLAEFGL